MRRLVLIFLALFIPLFVLASGFQLAGRAAALVDATLVAAAPVAAPLQTGDNLTPSKEADSVPAPAASVPLDRPAFSGQGEPGFAEPWFVGSANPQGWLSLPIGQALPDDPGLVAGGSPAWQAMQEEQAKARKAFQNSQRAASLREPVHKPAALRSLPAKVKDPQNLPPNARQAPKLPVERNLPVVIQETHTTPLAPTSSGVITGQVTAAVDGSPLGNIHVAASDYDSEANWYHGWTNPQGFYTLTGLYAGDYRVRVDDMYGMPENYAYQYWPYMYFHHEAERVNLGSDFDVITEIDFALEPGGRITGTVVDQNTGLPLANINVGGDLPWGGVGTCSDANGQFVMPNIPYGEYRVWAAQDWNWCLGQENLYAREYYNEVLDWDQATVLTLGAGSDLITDIDFSLEPGAMITGQVTAEVGGAPLANVYVQVHEYDQSSFGFGAWTDAQGYYTITGIIPADYRLEVSTDDGTPDGYAYQVYPGSFDWEQAQRITVSAYGELLSDYDLALPPGGTFSGVVVDQASGLPLEDIHLGVDLHTGGGWGVCSGAGGSFEIDHMPYGVYSAWASGDWNWCQNSQSIYVREYYQEQFRSDLATPLALDAGSALLTGIDFTLEHGATIRGRVTSAATGAPLADYHVSASEYDDGWYRSDTRTDANGYYTLTQLAPAQYRIMVEDDADMLAGGFAYQYYPYTFDWNAAERVTINSTNDHLSGYDFALEPGGMVTGVVRDQLTNEPLANIHISAISDAGEVGHCTDENGVYTFGGLLYAEFTLQAGGEWNWCQNQPSQYAREYFEEVIYPWEATPLGIDAVNDSYSAINFTLEEGGQILGRVTDRDTGAPLADVHVSASTYDDEWSWGSGWTDAQGYYTITGLIPEDYRVRVDDSNHLPAGYIFQFYDDRLYHYLADRVAVGYQATVNDIDFALDKGGYLSGTIWEDQVGGAPAAGLRVHAYVPRTDWCPWCYEHIGEADTDANGNYILGALPEVPIAIYACSDCSNLPLVNVFYGGVYALQDASLVTPLPDQTISNLNIVLETGIMLSGQVTAPPGYTPADLNVDVWTWDNQYFAHRSTNPDGSYTIPVPPLYDQRWGLAINPWGTDLAIESADGFDLAEYQSFDFDLEPGGTITGVVTHNGLPVPNIQVNAWDDHVGNGNRTDANGVFTITNLPPSSYRIDTDGFPDYARTYYGGHEWDWATLVPVGEAETVGGLSIEVAELGSLEGSVYESDGVTPIEGIRVTAMTEDGIWNAYTQPDGAFYMELPATTVKVFFNSESNPQTAYLYYGGHTFADATPVVVPPMSSGPAVISMNLPRRGSLTGQVTDTDSGEPLGGIHVAAHLVDPAFPRDDAWWACTDENGNYTIGDMIIAGEVEVIAQGACGNDGYGAVTIPLSIVEGVTTTQDIQLSADSAPPAPFTIRADDSFDYTPLASMQGLGIENADQILAALYEPLVQMDDQGNWFSELLEQVPSEANGGVVIADNQMVVTYVLKSGLRWSDGAPLTSADIRTAWELTTQPHPWYDTYYAQVGVHHKIESIATPDALTAVLTYARGHFPSGYLGAILYPMPTHLVGGMHAFDLRWLSEYVHHPVGNGPYMITNWSPGAYLDLAANPNYHKRSEGYPRIPEVRFLFNGHPFWSLFHSAEVSLNISDHLPPNYEDFGFNIQTGNSGGFDSLILNNTRPFFSDLQVRKALSHALNRQAFIDQYQPGYVPAFSWLPPEHPLATPASIHEYPFNLATAASLLDAAGWLDHNGDGVRDKDGVEFSFDIPLSNLPDNWRTPLYVLYQSDLASIGVDANLVNYDDWGAMIEDCDHGRTDTCTLGWYFDSRLDPFGYDFLHSSRIPSPFNSYRLASRYTAWWSHPDNDAFLEATLNELDKAALTSLYASQVDLWTQETPFLPTRYYSRQDAATPTLLNFKPAQHTPATWNIEEWYLPPNPYDLTVRKALAVASAAPQPGVDIIYRLDVANRGYFPVTNVHLVDNLPPEVSYVSATPAPAAINGLELTWNLNTINGGTSLAAIFVTVHIPDTVAHGTELVNSTQVYGDQPDTYPSSNLFQHSVEVRDDIDLALTKYGVGQPAVGEQFSYYLDYANWGGAPASGALITDVLPAQVSYLGADPAPTQILGGGTLVWALPELTGGQWGGQIEILTEIDATGTVINNAEVDIAAVDVDLTNNQDSHSEIVNSILAPVILRPTQGTTDRTPTVSGLAPSSSIVTIYDLTASYLAGFRLPNAPEATLLMTTTAGLDGTFSLELDLAEGSYYLAATAEKAGLLSDYSNGATIVVDHNLPLDPDLLTIKAGEVDFSAGAVRAERYALAFRTMYIDAQLACPVAPVANLYVTENGVLNYAIPAVSTSDLGGGQWSVALTLWLAEAHSTYDVWLEWGCDGAFERELLLYVLIDPDGYVYNAAEVAAGGSIEDSLILGAEVTAYVKYGDTWVPWPADLYGQTNPQLTDPLTDDGVQEAGYYSFLTPPGLYKIEAIADGYQPFESPVLTVITTPVHLDIGLFPVVAGTGLNLAPVNLSSSAKTVDKYSAWVGEELEYTISLSNSGAETSGVLRLEDLLPDHTAYVAGSLSWTAGLGEAGYDAATETIWWEGSLSGGAGLELSYRLRVVDSPGAPFNVVNTSSVSGPAANLISLPSLSAVTSIENAVGVALLATPGQSADPGETLVFSHRITNTGNAPDTYTFSAGGDQAWSLTAPEPLALGTGAAATVQLQVTVPSNSPAGLQATFWLTATSQTAPNLYDLVEDHLVVNQAAALSLSGAQSLSGDRGETVVFSHSVTNLGNGSDTFSLSVQPPAGYSYTTSPGVLLAPGASGEVSLSVTIPLDAADGAGSNWQVTVTSAFDAAASAAVLDTLQVDYGISRIMLPVIQISASGQ